jgi:heptosyltransferase-2
MDINKILFITLSNIGDVILSLPVLDGLRENFSGSQITVMVGPRPKEIFENNPYINKLIVYQKHSGLKDKIKLFNELKRERFDMVVDLRNSFFGAFLPAQYKTSPFLGTPKNIKHMKDRHWYRLQEVTRGFRRFPEVRDKKSLYISQRNEEYINDILKENNIKEGEKIVVVSAGARSHIKRWPQDKFIELISTLAQDFSAKVILAGDKNDAPITKYISENLKYAVLDLAGKTNISQLACLLKKAALLVTNDSAALHLGSYLNTPTLAIFGPTDEEQYGPWSEISAVVKKDIFCRPCAKAQCRFGTIDCMRLIKIEDALRQARDILAVSGKSPAVSKKNIFKRILIVRTDRIGDVLLSTPAIKALRDSFPYAYIAMMVSPYAKDIVDGNPYLDEAIIYDKGGLHKSWRGSLKFAQNLKKKRFDLAIILHPTNRVHLVTFFAGIAKRIGYDRKLGFLLTDRIKHTKQLGEKHELEYNLDLLKYLGIEPKDKSLFMPIKEESERYVDELFKQEGINKKDKLLAIHPGASCPSKIWPQERFAEVADRLAENQGFKVLVIAGPKDIALAQKVTADMRHPAVNLAGKTSVAQLASVLERCQLFISNDSGPVHIASAVGTPVISIFGRNQRGLSPLRWGPVGEKDRILHKEVGCIECLAHNCVKEFACLRAISVADVLSAADSILRDTQQINRGTPNNLFGRVSPEI